MLNIMSNTDKPKRKIDYKVLFISRVSPLYDTSKAIIIFRFIIPPNRVVFAPITFLETTIERAKSDCPLLKNLAIEALESITHAQRV